MAKKIEVTPLKKSIAMDAAAKSVVVEHLTLTHPLVVEYLSKVRAGDRVEELRKANGTPLLL